MPNHRIFSALFGIKLLHTIAFLVVSAAILYILYSGLLNLGGTGLVIAVMIVVLEIAVFTANGMHCPLTKIAQRLGDEAGNDFIADIFLPERLMRLVPPVCGALAFIGLLLIGGRLLMG
jgi:hypothetical protein